MEKQNGDSSKRRRTRLQVTSMTRFLLARHCLIRWRWYFLFWYMIILAIRNEIKEGIEQDCSSILQRILRLIPRHRIPYFGGGMRCFLANLMSAHLLNSQLITQKSLWLEHYLSIFRNYPSYEYRLPGICIFFLLTVSLKSANPLVS